MRRMGSMQIAALACAVMVQASEATAQQHPWDGGARKTWVRQVAEKSFVFDKKLPLAQVPELFMGPPPGAFYIGSPEADAAPKELHVVGAYEAEEASTTPDGQLVPKVIQVFVRRTERPIVLYLTSYEGVTWEIKAEDGVRFDAIYRSSHEPATVQGAPASVPIRDVSERTYLFQLERTSPSDEDGEVVLERIAAIVGAPVQTFQGAYVGKTFVVPAYHDKSVVRDVQAEHARLLEERTVQSAHAFDLVQGGVVLRRGDPKVPDRPVLTVSGASLKAVTYSDVDSKFYGVSSQEAYVIDTATGVATALVPPSGFPRFSWLGGVAYDKQRKRIVITTSWHTGFHLTYAPSTKEWRVFPVTKTGGGIRSVVYDPKQGMLLGIVVDHATGGVLGVFDGDLTPVRAVRAQPNPGILGRGPDNDVQMAMAGDQAIVCSDPEGSPFGRGRLGGRRAPAPTAPRPMADTSDCVLDPQRGVVCGRAGSPAADANAGQPSMAAPPTCFLIDPASGVTKRVRFGFEK